MKALVISIIYLIKNVSPMVMKQVYPTSGSIKIGFGDDFDFNGNKINKYDVSYPRMPDKIKYKVPVIKDQNDDQPDYISFPDTIMASPEKQRPIVIVPEIVYPHKKKRIFVHHKMPLKNMFHASMMSSPTIMNLAVKNPHYQQYVTPEIKQMFKSVPYPDDPLLASDDKLFI